MDVVSKTDELGHSNSSSDELSQRTLRLMHVVYEESKRFNGFFGEFVVKSPVDFGEQFVKHNHQDIQYDLTQLVFINDNRYTQRVASWLYSEPEGVFISRAYAEANDDENAASVQGEEIKPGNGEALTEENKETDAPTTTTEKATGDEKSEAKEEKNESGEEQKQSEETEGKSDDSDDEEAVNCPCIKTKKLIFIVFHVSRYEKRFQMNEIIIFFIPLIISILHSCL